MYFSKTLLAAIAVSASGVVARPNPQNAPRGLVFYKRVDNTTTDISNTTTSTDSSAASSTSVPVSLSTSDLTSTTSGAAASSTIASTVLSSTSSGASPSVTASGSSVVASSVVSSSASSASASASATASAQAIPVQGGTFTAVGCYSDPSNTGFPLLGAILASNSSTSQQCLNLCADPTIGGPYTFAGVEGAECFCSNSFASSVPQTPGSCPSTGMKKRDSFEKRAGGSIAIFQFTPTAAPSSSSTSSTVSSSTVSVSSSSSTASQSSNVTSSTLSSSTGTATVTTASSSSASNSGSQTSTAQSSTSTPSQTGSAPPSFTFVFPPPPAPFTVSPDDTLASIAEALGLAVEALEALNNQIQNPNNLQPGQVINVPASVPNPRPPFLYTVAPGDTLSSLAQEFGVPLAALEAANPQITNPNNISPGEVINIPSPSRTSIPYVVAPGDTLSSIAQRFGISLAALLAANNQISDPNLIFPGQIINIPTQSTFPYTVIPGDFLAAIAEEFGTSLAALEAVNPQITNPDLIFPDQVINVPVTV